MAWQIYGDSDDVIGYEEIVGQAPLRSAFGGLVRTGGRQVLARTGPLPAYPGGQTVVMKGPEKMRENVMGLDSVSTIAAAATANVGGNPQVTFRPDRLVIPATIAASFLLNSFTVGRLPQFVNNTAVPAEAFTQAGVGVRLKGDTAQISQTINLNVTNISGAAARFTAALIGPIVE